MLRTLLPGIALLLAGCGGSTGAGVTAPASNVPNWSEPAAYQYALDSDCGERDLLGRYLITVTDGRVTDIEAGDQRAELIISDDELRSLVPTLGELLEEAQAAEESGADVVHVETDGDPAGRPGFIEIDYDTDADDDEACYSVFMFEDLTAPPPESTSSELPAAGELPQLPPSGNWPVTLQDPPPCDDDAMCEAGFVIGEVFYGIGCTRVLDEFVTDEAITDGSDAVHVIDGVDPLALVAQRGPAQACDEFEEVPEGLAWHMAFGPKDLAGDVICRVGDFNERQARANGC